ncbi:MAG: hypothetical protein PVI91_16675, partial [Gammaproteobacteria bacterium]
VDFSFLMVCAYGIFAWNRSLQMPVTRVRLPDNALCTANYCSGSYRKRVSLTAMIQPAELVEVRLTDDEGVALGRITGILIFRSQSQVRVAIGR